MTAKTAKAAKAAKTAPDWEEIKRTRAAVSVGEFKAIMGWSDSKYYEHVGKIRLIEGFGHPMIPVSEVNRILGESEEPITAA